MRRSSRRSLAAVFASLVACEAGAQAPPPPSSLLGEAVAVLRAAPALSGVAIDWDAEGVRLAAALPPEATLSDAHHAIARAVALLQDPHARFTPPPPAPDARPAAEAEAKPAPDAAPPRPPVPMWPEGRMLEDDIAYVVVPMCDAPDADGLRAYALAMRALIADLSGKRPTGWVVEQRFNGGGNVWPMLLGLEPLLGDGAMATSVVRGEMTQVFGVDQRSAWLESGGQREEQLSLTDEPPPTQIRAGTPIALLNGPWTMSSGEMIALAFRGRARSFGEPTAGLTTVTYPFPLSDGSTLWLPVSRMGDHEGRAATGALAPDEPVAIGDWPRDDDEVVRAAIRWIRAQPERK